MNNVTLGDTIVWDESQGTMTYVVKSLDNLGTELNTLQVNTAVVNVSDLLEGVTLSDGLVFNVRVASKDAAGLKGEFSADVAFTLTAPLPPENIRVG